MQKKSRREAKREAMDRRAIEKAAGSLIDARRTGRLIDALPADCSPASADDAHAIQTAVVAALGDSVGGWKVAAPIDGKLVRGAILRSRIFNSPARVKAADMGMLGVEAEIAFQVDRALGPRARDYSRDEVAGSVTAFAAIEIVDSRFKSYKDASLLDRSADFVSNGGFVRGALRPDWRNFDLAKIEVTLAIGGREIARKSGGHPTGDPLLPLLALANDLRSGGGIPLGAVVTTGTYTGLNFAKPGQTVAASFTGFGAAEVRFEA